MFSRTKFAEDVKELSAVSSWRGGLAVVTQWSVVLAAAALAVWSGHWAAYLLAVIIIGSRQHAMAILMHDASHYRLLRNRLANDLVSDLFLAFPVGVSTSLYRKRHLDHHRYTNTDADPDWHEMHQDEDWCWPKLRWESAKLFAGDLLGLNAAKTLKIISNWSPWPKLFVFNAPNGNLNLRERLCLVGIIASTATILFFTGLWIPFLVLWILPSLTVLGAIFRIRSIAEHLVTENTCELNASRTVTPTLLERLLIAPCNVNYHLEHHLFPSIPFYNLPEIHRRLMVDEEFRAKAHLTTTYFGLTKGVLAELTVATPDPLVVLGGNGRQAAQT
jgi:fatty acid desaturase